MAGLADGFVQQLETVLAIKLIGLPHPIKRLEVAPFVTSFPRFVQQQHQQPSPKSEPTRRGQKEHLAQFASEFVAAL